MNPIQVTKLFLPVGEAVFAAVVGAVVLGILEGAVVASGVGFGLAVLGVDVHGVAVPDDNLVTLIAGEVDKLGAHLGVAVVGKGHDAVAFSVEGSFVGAHPDKFLAVAIPVERADDVAVGKHLAVPDFLAVAVM